ncbi:hypothetical protein SUGI_0444340 [Cryptomeria japonica]|nr:hypothetical protein SUGI_0444340 [Cryptomeria japonica]
MLAIRRVLIYSDSERLNKSSKTPWSNNSGTYTYENDAEYTSVPPAKDYFTYEIQKSFDVEQHPADFQLDCGYNGILDSQKASSKATNLDLLY